jgi:hypothetical protein
LSASDVRQATADLFEIREIRAPAGHGATAHIREDGRIWVTR